MNFFTFISHVVSLQIKQPLFFSGFTFSPLNRNFVLEIQVMYLCQRTNAGTFASSRILFPMFLLLFESFSTILSPGKLSYSSTASMVRSPLIFIGTCGNTREGSILAFHNNDTWNTLWILSKYASNSNR
jgi:hypothetical protein